MLAPVRFIQRHHNVGDPHPDETRRLVGMRRTALADAKKRQANRRGRLDEAGRRLAAEVAAILALNE